MATISNAVLRRGADERPRASLALWVALLGLAQAADLLTTSADMQWGAAEANLFAAGLISLGGLGLLWLVKVTLVGAMALAALLVATYRRRDPHARSDLPRWVVRTGLKACVLVLALAAIHNLIVLGQLAGWVGA